MSKACLLFFNIYINDLLNQIRDTGCGARMAGFPVGAIDYADDIKWCS